MNPKQKKIEKTEKKQDDYPSHQLGFKALLGSLKPSKKVGYIAFSQVFIDYFSIECCICSLDFDKKQANKKLPPQIIHE